jgi:RNA polymerase sigma-70 factor (ECF subfamily)
MSEEASERVPEMVDDLYRAESRRVLATLIRLLGDFDLAEEALHEAFRAALEQWPREGVPANPRAWLVSAGRFKAIDGIRRNARFDPLGEDAENIAGTDDPASWAADDIEDDRLPLIFTCCHPAPFEVRNTVEFTLTPSGGATNVTWAMHGPAPFVAKIIHVFIDMDRMVGSDFEAGLASLKAAAER